ncbi:MAG TPA: RtcB family protein [Gammaproteobacteria bacterium]|nr:RtcB family protein [Gammaproteobacteria bacterium]
MGYKILNFETGEAKAWIEGVQLEEEAIRQIRNCAGLPFIHRHIAIMPDAHMGFGSTVGSVIPTRGAIIPAAVGVDIGCGMMACRLSMKAGELPDNLSAVRSAIEKAVPHGRTHNAGPNDRGAWRNIPRSTAEHWAALESDTRLQMVQDKHPGLFRGHVNTDRHLGTLGTGNHFIELCIDENQDVWAMLHSGSRGIGNRIGTYFIELAKEDMERLDIHLPERDLSYFSEGAAHFDDYVAAVGWAQDYARTNRALMMENTIAAVEKALGRKLLVSEEAVNCHHNYVTQEHHFGADIWVTRKGAVRARKGELGIIPGSMGAKSFIVRGKGNAESFCSCSHGAGRTMSRTQARKQFTVEDHIKATRGVECRKDEDVIDETPMAYKDIDAVMAAQADLVEIVHTLKQVVCVKG